MSDYRRGLDWWIDLLTTYTYDSELQVITAPPLISTIRKSPQHPLSLFPARYIFISRSLATASYSGDSSASRAEVLTSQPSMQNWTILNWLCSMLITSRHGPRRNTPFSLLQSNCCIIKNLPSNENVFTEQLHNNGRCLQSNRLTTGPYATLHTFVGLRIVLP
jgi:hypothetical protein